MGTPLSRLKAIAYNEHVKADRVAGGYEAGNAFVDIRITIDKEAYARLLVDKLTKRQRKIVARLAAMRQVFGPWS